jgi:hypothetical protein
MSETSVTTAAYGNVNGKSHRGDLIVGARRGTIVPSDPVTNQRFESHKNKIVRQRGHHDAIGDGIVHRSSSLSNAAVDGDVLSTTDVAVTIGAQQLGAFRGNAVVCHDTLSSALDTSLRIIEERANNRNNVLSSSATSPCFESSARREASRSHSSLDFPSSRSVKSPMNSNDSLKMINETTSRVSEDRTVIDHRRLAEGNSLHAVDIACADQCMLSQRSSPSPALCEGRTTSDWEEADSEICFRRQRSGLPDLPSSGNVGDASEQMRLEMHRLAQEIAKLQEASRQRMVSFDNVYNCQDALGINQSTTDVNEKKQVSFGNGRDVPVSTESGRTVGPQSVIVGDNSTRSVIHGIAVAEPHYRAERGLRFSTFEEPTRSTERSLRKANDFNVGTIDGRYQTSTSTDANRERLKQRGSASMDRLSQSTTERDVRSPDRRRRSLYTGDKSSSSSTGDDNDQDCSSRSPRRNHQRNSKRKSKRGNTRDEPGSSPNSNERDSRSHRDKRTSHSGRWMKPDKFDGRCSFETFIYQFENCAAYNKWNSGDKLAHLRWSLSGIAAQLLWNSDSLSYG